MAQRVTQVDGGKLDEVGLDVRGHAGAAGPAAAGPAHGRHVAAAASTEF